MRRAPLLPAGGPAADAAPARAAGAPATPPAADPEAAPPAGESRPDLAIVLPTRDGAARLGAMLAQLLAEIDRAGARTEIVAVDDRSTDATPAILAAAARADARIRPITGPGRGPGAARNAGVRATRAPLVAFADDDDPWTPGRLGAQLAAHRAHPDAALSFCDYAHQRADAPAAALPTAFAYWPLWRRLRARPLTRLEDARPLIAAENAVGTSTVMLRRDAFLAVGGFDEGLRSASDWDLWLRLAAAGPALALGAVGARYAMRAGSVSADRGARLEAMRAILARHPELPGWAVRRARARLATGLSEAAAERGAHGAALGHALRALAIRPGAPQLRRALGLARACLAKGPAPRPARHASPTPHPEAPCPPSP